MNEPLTTRRIPDSGDPLSLWSGPEESESRFGLLCFTSFCDSPECRAAHINGLVIDDAIKELVVAPGKVSSVRHEPTATDASGRTIPRRWISSSINVDTGEVSTHPDDPKTVPSDDELECLRRGADENVLSVLQRRLRQAKGLTDRDSWRLKDWGWWSPGTMIPYMEVFPDEIDFIVEGDDWRSWVVDYYCVTPGCSCRNVRLSFEPLGTGGISDPFGSVVVDSRRLSAVEVDPTTVSKQELHEMFKAFRAQKEFCALIPKRRRELVRVGRTIAGGDRELPREQSPLPPTTQQPVRARTPRNAACPCGSGSKYKNCCGKNGNAR